MTKSVAVEQKLGFKAEEVEAIRLTLERKKAYRDLALFTLALDSFLRGSDLILLRLDDIVEGDGQIKLSFPLKQRKTGYRVEPVLTSTTRTALKNWIEFSGKSRGDFLFTHRDRREGKHLSTSGFRRLVKKWAVMIGLDHRKYSGHSLRRTKAIFMYQQGVPIEELSQLLGHNSTAVTLHYLGITQAHLQAQALKYDIFNYRSVEAVKEGWSDEDMERFADLVAQKLALTLAQKV